MPSTVVHVGFALLLAAGLLGTAYDRRALLVVAGTYLYADTNWRDESLIRARVGDEGVRVAWVAIVAFCLSAVGLDMFTAAGVNPFYPLFDQFYAFNGQVQWSTVDGLTQTFVQVKQETPDAPTGGSGGGGGVDVGQKGSTREYRVASGVDPSRGREPANVERVFPVVYNGWQTFLTLSGIVVTALKLRGLPSWTDRPESRPEGEVPSTEAPESSDVEATDD